MRRRRVASGLAMSLALLVTVPASTAHASTLSVLRYAKDVANDAYRLKLDKSCEIGDGLAVVNNVGDAPLRLTSISVLYGDGASAHQANTTYDLISLRRGTSEGQLGATFHVVRVDGGVSMGNALNRVLQPLSTSGRSYDIVANVLVTVDHPKPWSIVGLRVTYRVGARSYATVLAQSITVSSTPVC